MSIDSKSRQSKGFGIAGTPRGDVLLNQDLLRIIANFVGPLSDLVIGLTLPFKRLHWGIYRQGLWEEWLCPGTFGKEVEKVQVIWSLRGCGGRMPSGLMEEIYRWAENDQGYYYGPYLFWRLLGYPLPSPLVSKHRDLVELQMQCVPPEDPVGTLWALGEGKEALLFMSGTSKREIGERLVAKGTKFGFDLYIRGFIPWRLTKPSGAQILDLCWDKKTRHLAVPFLRRGDFINDAPADEHFGKGSPLFLYGSLMRDSNFETFMFIRKYVTLDVGRLMDSIHYASPRHGEGSRIIEYILFNRRMEGYKLRMGETKRDTDSDEEECPRLSLQRLISRLYLYREDRETNFTYLHLGLRILVVTHLSVHAVTTAYLLGGMLEYLGSGFFDRREAARAGESEKKIDEMLKSLSEGKKGRFLRQFSNLMFGGFFPYRLWILK